MFYCTGKHTVLDMAGPRENQSTQNNSVRSSAGISITRISFHLRGNLVTKLSLLFLPWQKYCVAFDYTCVQKDILSFFNLFVRLVEEASFGLKLDSPVNIGC